MTRLLKGARNLLVRLRRKENVMPVLRRLRKNLTLRHCVRKFSV